MDREKLLAMDHYELLKVWLKSRRHESIEDVIELVRQFDDLGRFGVVQYLEKYGHE